MKTEFTTWLTHELNLTNITVIAHPQSAEQNKVYQLTTDKGTYFLKHGPNLKSERDRLVWLENKLPAPKVAAWRECADGQEELVTVAIEGKDLSEIASAAPKEQVVIWLADVLKSIHAIDITDCPFGEMKEGYVFTHGDACLPNFIFKDNTYMGAIDLGAAGIADRDTDLAAAVWSLALNCGKGYGLQFLHAYGYTSATEVDEVRLIKKYEPKWSGY